MGEDTRLDFINGCKDLLDKVVVFGAGEYGCKTIAVLKHYGVEVISCYDNNKSKIGKLNFKNVNVCFPEYTEYPVIISVLNKEIQEKIYNQLKKLECNKIFTINDRKLNIEIQRLPDKEFLNLNFFLKFHREMDWNNPKTFNEKLQWLKLYDRNPMYTKLVDKVAVKDYVVQIIGKEYVIPTIAVWNKTCDIDFKNLPEKFVIKCNHDSGNIIIVNKDDCNIEEIKKCLDKTLNNDYYLFGREWPYKNVQRKIFAEQYLVDESGCELIDYKLMCFNGQVKCSFTCSNRLGKEGLYVNFYDRKWQPMPFERHYPRKPKEIQKPVSYEKMVELAEILSKGIPFVRVDFYQIDEKPLLGELTFYPGNGMEEFTPDKWDYCLGSWLNLPG